MNSNLYNKTIQLPDKVVEYLQICFDHIPNSDPSIEGHKRNEELRNSGYATYQQLGRIKNWFDNYNGDKTDAPFILNGADYMKNWVNTTLEDLRNHEDASEFIQQEFMPNSTDDLTLKNLGPLGDMISPSKEHSRFVQDISIKEDLDRINNLIKKII